MDWEMVERLRHELDRGPLESDIDNVVPIIVPRDYFALGKWPGPYALLRSPFLGLTWSVLRPEQTMIYVNHERCRLWASNGIDWQARAMGNLERLSAEYLWTHERRDASGELNWIAMMHEDGLGTSRLLLRDQLLAALGSEYRVGIPDRSCALVVPLSTPAENLRDVAEMVQGAFQGATTPMLGTMLDPSELEIQD